MPRNLQLRLLHLDRPQPVAPGGGDGGIVGGQGRELDGDQKSIGGDGDVGDDGAGCEEVFVKSRTGIGLAALVEDGESCEGEEGEEIKTTPAGGFGGTGSSGKRGVGLRRERTRSGVFCRPQQVPVGPCCGCFMIG